jgi:hypothetical protein
VGYLTATYAQVDDPENLFTRTLSQVTARDGFPSRDELVAQYEERTRALDVRPALVPGSRAVEVGGLPRGQLQALRPGCQ